MCISTLNHLILRKGIVTIDVIEVRKGIVTIDVIEVSLVSLE